MKASRNKSAVYLQFKYVDQKQYQESLKKKVKWWMKTRCTQSAGKGCQSEICAMKKNLG